MEKTPYYMRSICVEGIPVSDDLKELYGIEATLYDLFEEYQPESISMIPGKGACYVKLSDEELVNSAIQALNGSRVSSEDYGICQLLMTRMEL